MHHTFNVKHPDTWNWTVGLNSMMAGRGIRFTATATDPGADNLTFEWESGDGTPTATSTYLCGGTFPFTATDTELHTYVVAGTYTLNLKVSDDDGGSATLTMTTLTMTIQIG